METGARQALFVTPPLAGQQGFYATSNVVATQDLRLIGPQVATTDSNATKGPPGAQLKYITVTALTSDCFVCFGSTLTAVGSITASTTGTNQPNTAMPIFAGTSRDFRLGLNDLFMGFITAANAGNVHVYISSNM